MLQSIYKVHIYAHKNASDKTYCQYRKCCGFSSVDQKIDLNVITQTFSNVEYIPEQFPDLVLE